MQSVQKWKQMADCILITSIYAKSDNLNHVPHVQCILGGRDAQYGKETYEAG